MPKKNRHSKKRRAKDKFKKLYYLSKDLTKNDYSKNLLYPMVAKHLHPDLAKLCVDYLPKVQYCQQHKIIYYTDLCLGCFLKYEEFPQIIAKDVWDCGSYTLNDIVLEHGLYKYAIQPIDPVDKLVFIQWKSFARDHNLKNNVDDDLGQFNGLDDTINLVPSDGYLKVKNNPSLNEIVKKGGLKLSCKIVHSYCRCNDNKQACKGLLWFEMSVS